jgi:hypothetical protein
MMVSRDGRMVGPVGESRGPGQKMPHGAGGVERKLEGEEGGLGDRDGEQ